MLFSRRIQAFFGRGGNCSEVFRELRAAGMVMSGVYRPYVPSKATLKSMSNVPDGVKRVEQLKGLILEAYGQK